MKKTRVRHGDDNINNSDLPNTNDDNQNEKPLNDSEPIEIESMKTATHSNMETSIEGDLYETMRQNIEFRRRTDQNFNQLYPEGTTINFPVVNDNINANNAGISNDNININNNGNEFEENIPLNDNTDRKILVKDFFLKSRLTKFFPHLFVN